MKVRMSSLDVAGEVACLKQRLLGLRVANVYDLNAKTYVLKMARSGEDGEKVFLLLESGSRFHTTEVMGEKSDIPSNFTLKLRKHMRTRRLEDVRQLGVDRIVDFVFGSGEAQYHLILEMYSQGNVILTDSKYEVLTLLRSHRDDEKGFAVMARHPYPMHAVRLRTSVPMEDLGTAFANAAPGSTMKSALAALLPYGPAVSEHVLLDAGLDPGLVVPAEGGLPAEQVAMVHAAVRRLEEWFEALEIKPPAGYISLQPSRSKGKKKKQQGGGDVEAAEQLLAPEPETGEAAKEEVKVYQDFNPLLLNQAKEKPHVSFDNFDIALDDFFSKIAGQRAELAKADAEQAAMGKLERMKADQSHRVSALEREAEAEEQCASLIEYNLDVVDAAIGAVNEALATGMDWHDLDRMIRDERRAGNPVAGLIHSLQLDQNQITLLLSNFLDDGGDGGIEDDEAMTRPATKVSVDLSLSAHSNACAHYSARKKHVVKQNKTLAANEQALKAAEKKAQQQLLKVRSQQAPVAPRKPHWFERFNWFISSENYLVISGRDAQQNELIVKRYFKKGDAYVHADLHGASSTIIKNPTPEQPIPPLTLQQAGCACVCRSKAWDSKMVTSAWWVHHHQVSKTAPTGEYLVAGSFMIRGKKNFLPPQPLVFGFGFMFKLEPGCIAAHIGERSVRSAGLDGEGSIMPDDEADTLDMSDLDIDSDGEEEGESKAAGSLGTGSRTMSTTSALDRFLEGSMDPLSKQYKRYGLDMEAEEDTHEHKDSGSGGGPPGEQGPGRRHMSAKEREMMKKGGGTAATSSAAPAGKGAAAATAAAGKAGGGGGVKGSGGGGGGKASAIEPEQVGSSGKARGKKGKQQRAKEKYADQDEEERLLALELLQSQGTKKSRADRQKERRERKEAKRKAIQGDLPGVDEDAMQEAIKNALGREFKKADASDDSEDASEDASVAEEGAGPEAAEKMVEVGGGDGDGGGGDDANADGQVTTAMEEDKEAAPMSEVEKAEIKALLAEENLTEMTEEDKEKLTVLDSLTGCPRADDTLLFAVPVCGPYNALQGYKYKVKLIPGTQKKGKASRQALELLVRGPDVLQRERELLKASPEMDAINAMVGAVKISMPGLTKMKQDEKKNKKAKAKAKAKAAPG